MKEVVAIFPVTRDIAPLIRCFTRMMGKDIIPILPLSLKHLDGEDLSELDGGVCANIPLTVHYQKALEGCDALYVETTSSVNEKFVDEVVHYAKQRGIEIINTHKESVDLFDEELELSLTELKEIPVPVISVFSLGYHCNQTAIELLIREYFQQKGYKILQITSNSVMGVFDIKNVPAFIWNDKIGPEKRSILFNHFVWELYNAQLPDLIIVGVLEPVMKHNNKILNGLGNIPFIIQNALQSDIGIVNLYSEIYSEEYFRELQSLFKYRLNTPVNYFHIANIKALIDQNNSSLKYVMVDYTLTQSEIDRAEFSEDICVFNAFNHAQAWQVCEKMEQELLVNAEVM